MNGSKCMLLVVLFFCILINYAITIDDVKKLDINTFFGKWSQFLDQVWQAKQEPLAAENEAVYQAFMQQAKSLNIVEVTGNKEFIAGMQHQIDLIKKRISEEKNFFAEWEQFCESVLSEKQFPLSPEREEAYQNFLQRAKNLNIEQDGIEKMYLKMGDINEKLLAESVKKDPEQQAARLDELEKKVAEMSEKLHKEGEQKGESRAKALPVEMQP